jgi:hypothetical protein
LGPRRVVEKESRWDVVLGTEKGKEKDLYLVRGLALEMGLELEIDLVVPMVESWGMLSQQD